MNCKIYDTLKNHFLRNIDFYVGYNVRILRSVRNVETPALARELGFTIAEFESCEAGRKRSSAKSLFLLSTIWSVAPSAFFTHFDEAIADGMTPYDD